MSSPAGGDPTTRSATASAATPATGDAAAQAADATVFAVDLEVFQGSLEDLVARAQRGEIDLAAVPVAEITSAYRARVAAGGVDPRAVADFLALASRLLSLKAARLLPDGALDALEDAAEGALGEVDDPGRRLAEYRLFRAAAEALLADAAAEGMRSFLGIVAAEVVPAERLSIAPERLAAAFRRILERLPEPEPFSVEAVTFSVEDKVVELRRLLAERGRITFDEVFAAVRSRLEAVACFLALLELVKLGEATVEQAGAFDGIEIARISAGGGPSTRRLPRP